MARRPLLVIVPLAALALSGLSASAAPTRDAAASPYPTERVVDATTVATRTRIITLSADGRRVAFAPDSTGADCAHVAVWMPAAKKLDRFRSAAPCSDRLAGVYQYELRLADSRAVWVDVGLGGNCYPFELVTATLADRTPRRLASGSKAGCGRPPIFHVYGDGDVLVFNNGPFYATTLEYDRHRARLVRISAGGKQTVIRSVEHACCVASVSGGLIAIDEPDAVAVLDKQGGLVRVFPFGADAARLDAGLLVVARLGALETYDVATGMKTNSRPLPRGYALTDVDGGIALLHSSEHFTNILLRLSNGRSYVLPNHSVFQFADLEPPGLYYSYATRDGQGRVVFVPRAEVKRRLARS